MLKMKTKELPLPDSPEPSSSFLWSSACEDFSFLGETGFTSAGAAAGGALAAGAAACGFSGAGASEAGGADPPFFLPFFFDEDPPMCVF